MSNWALAKIGQYHRKKWRPSELTRSSIVTAMYPDAFYEPSNDEIYLVWESGEPAGSGERLYFQRISIKDVEHRAMEFPGKNNIQNPLVDLCYEIDIQANPEDVWPWIKQVGYHRAGWYIDTWWDKFSQEYFWPRMVPKEAQGTYKPPADEILPEYQNIIEGDIVPDGPPGSAYYEVVEIQENSLLLLYATTHFNYMAPQFVYKTRFAPRGAFCWAFMLKKTEKDETRLISWWQAEAYPRKAFTFLKPFFILADGAHQRQILQGIKKRVERKGAS